MSLNPGDVIDNKYRIVRLIGEGGMGAVYEGENARIHRKVAIKVLHSGVASDADAVARFEREAQAAGRIGSEHIVEVLDLGNLADGDRYMVMEFMDGDSLADRIQSRGRLTPQELYPIAVQLLDALQAAHATGIIHRDMKPDNVYLVRRKNQDDFVKLLDFGISKFSAMSGEFSMTRTGAVMGTPYYMAPEQAKGARDIDHRVDLYAVGVILYEAISGQVPFNADTFNELLFKIVLEAPPSISAAVPGLDPGFAQVIETGMNREPSQRYQTAEQFQQALHAWAQGAQIQQYGNVSSAVQTGAFRPAMTPSAGAGSATLGTGTPGTWSSTGTFGQTGTQVPKKSPVGMLVGVTLGALVVLGGGGFAAYRMTSGASGDAAAAAAAEQERVKKENEAKDAMNKKLEQESTRERTSQARGPKGDGDGRRRKGQDGRRAQEARRGGREAQGRRGSRSQECLSGQNGNGETGRSQTPATIAARHGNDRSTHSHVALTVPTRAGPFETGLGTRGFEILKVSEIFDSIQGEGPCAGTPSAFLRLALCNLHCSWCDTRYTWDFERYDYAREVQERTPEAVAEQISSLARAHLVITGGEPLMQRAELETLLGLLTQGTFVEVETNGTVLPTPALLERVQQFNVSPKLANSGDPADLRLRESVLRALLASDKAIFKFVVESSSDVEEASALAERLGCPSHKIWLMPQAQNRAELQGRAGLIARESLRRGLKFSSRLHVELWDGERGR